MTQTPVATTIPTVTAAMADAYFLSTLRNPAWTAIAAADRDLVLLEAQRWLNGLCPNPDAPGCCGDFNEAWTAAVSELALALQQNPRAIISGVAASGAAGATGEIKRQKLGDLEQEFFQARSGEAPVVKQTSRYGVNAPLVLQAFPFLGDLLGCWLPSYGGVGAGRIVNRYRS